jgi:iron uptake system EfeUOB component EfeO/EfeM
LGEKMPIYEFYCDFNDVDFLIEIDADFETVEKLLDEYRNSDEAYNIIDWLTFLENKGIKAKIIEADYNIYF